MFPIAATSTKLHVLFWQGYGLLNLIASWLRPPWCSNGLVEAIQLHLGDSQEPSFLLSRAPNGPWSRYQVTVRTRNKIGDGTSVESISFTAFHPDHELVSKMSLETGDNAYRRIHFGPIGTSNVAGALLAERSSPISAEFQYELVIEPDLGDCCH